MRSILFGLILAAIFGIAFSPAYGSNISTDSSSYDYGDMLHVSGTVSSVQEGKFIILQIINPDNSDIVTADQFLPSADGSFSKSYPTEGPNWALDGDYTVKIFYEKWTETTIQFQSEPITEDSPSNLDSKKTDHNDELSSSNIASKNKEERETVTKNMGIIENPKTRIPDFPDLAKSPQSYIDRYNKEPAYKDWFDSQFPGQSVYEILGFPEPVNIPSWVKDNAEWWSTGKINDSDFISGIQYMIENEIIVIPNLPESSGSGETLPEWVRNNAEWWAQDHITDEDFVKGLEFLVKKGIIRID